MLWQQRLFYFILPVLLSRFVPQIKLGIMKKFKRIENEIPYFNRSFAVKFGPFSLFSIEKAN